MTDARPFPAEPRNDAFARNFTRKDTPVEDKKTARERVIATMYKGEHPGNDLAVSVRVRDLNELLADHERVTAALAKMTENRNEWASRMMELASAEARAEKAEAVLAAIDKFVSDAEEAGVILDGAEYFRVSVGEATATERAAGRIDRAWRSGLRAILDSTPEPTEPEAPSEDEWEYGTEYEVSATESVFDIAHSRKQAEKWAADSPTDTGLRRRRPAGPWEEVR